MPILNISLGVWHFVRLVFAALIVVVSVPMEGETHPLDPLSAVEIELAVEIISNTGRVDRNTRAVIITLDEPDKSEVLGWAPGDPEKRAAFTVLKVGGNTIEVVVDLVEETITNWTQLSNVQTAIQSEEWAEAQSLVKADLSWQAAMAARGITSFDDIFCESLSAGYFSDPIEEGRRLLKMPCYDVSGANINIYARPIEGLIAVVDLNEMSVLDVIDEGLLPVGTSTHDFNEASVSTPREPRRPILTSAPLGWNFTIDGRIIDWQGWRFHLGFDQRFGPVISLVTHRVTDGRRMVLYQGFVSEVFVPYMEVAPSWAFRTYLDSGEFGLGSLASPLDAGTDCPAAALFLDAHMADYLARVITRNHVICVFERNPERPLWRHYEALNGNSESRTATELVVRSIASVAHYDYVMDWVFTLAGEIRVDIGATGIDAVKALDAADIAPAIGESGSKVAPDLRAINHDHYFSLRLDLDIGGRENRFVKETVQTESLPETSLRRSVWRIVSEPLLTEASLSDGGGGEIWRIENPNLTSLLGHHPGYQIVTNAPVALLASEDWPQRRAAFTDADLWVTKNRPGELFAAGQYPNQSTGGDGLPKYTNGEAIASGDLVAWPTIGFRHITRPEDWPVMPTIWQSVLLRPYGFFVSNPALGVRRKFLADQE